MARDLELLRAWRSGDRRAGNELLNRHFDRIHRFFLNKADTNVEELVQRTFVACVEARDRLREDTSFRAFLFAIAHNVLMGHLRGLPHGAREVDFERESIVDLGASPTSVLAARDEEQLVVFALRQIPVESQVLLELYYWEDMTGAELGVLFGVPEDTARSRIRRAKELLQAAIHRAETSGWSTSDTAANLDQWARGLQRQLAPAR